MQLRQQLSLRSTFIFASTLTFVVLGTYLLFRYHTRELYNKKLMERANLAAYFYLEKDEVTEKAYKDIEVQYRKISNESIRLYHSKDKTIYIDDHLDFVVSDKILENIIKTEKQTFSMKDRQLAGLFYKDNQGDFIIVISGVDNVGNQQLVTLRWMLLVFCLLGLLLHYLLTSILSKKTFQPFSNLINRVNSIKPDNLNARLDVPSGKPDEMKSLIMTFNAFLERLEHTFMIQRNFLKNASHELKTPLAVLIGDIDVALKYPRENKEYKELLVSLKKDGLHLKSIIESLLTLSSLEIPFHQEMKPIRIDEILWDVLEKKQIEYSETKVSIDFRTTTDIEDFLLVTGNRELLFIALNNIIDNAIKFSVPKPITVIADVADEKLVISIIDKGPGIPASDQAKIFELFYRGNQTKHTNGYGIGLFLTKQILTLHHIDLDIQSIEKKGTSIHLTFPS